MNTGPRTRGPWFNSQFGQKLSLSQHPVQLQTPELNKGGPSVAVAFSIGYVGVSRQSPKDTPWETKKTHEANFCEPLKLVRVYLQSTCKPLTLVRVYLQSTCKPLTLVRVYLQSTRKPLTLVRVYLQSTCKPLTLGRK